MVRCWRCRVSTIQLFLLRLRNIREKVNVVSLSRSILCTFAKLLSFPNWTPSLPELDPESQQCVWWAVEKWRRNTPPCPLADKLSYHTYLVKFKLLSLGGKPESAFLVPYSSASLGGYCHENVTIWYRYYWCHWEILTAAHPEEGGCR